MSPNEAEIHYLRLKVSGLERRLDFERNQNRMLELLLKEAINAHTTTGTPSTPNTPEPVVGYCPAAEAV